jgi:hypothetical protein
MNDDLVGVGGLLGCIVLLVLYALAIGAKTKQQASKSLKPIQSRSTRKTPTTNVVNLTYRRHLREVLEWSRKALWRPDFAIRHSDPVFWDKYKRMLVVRL